MATHLRNALVTAGGIVRQTRKGLFSCAGVVPVPSPDRFGCGGRGSQFRVTTDSVHEQTVMICTCEPWLSKVKDVALCTTA